MRAAAAALLATLASPSLALAQSATGVGVGVSSSSSQSSSSAQAIGGGNANAMAAGGQGLGGQSSLTINNNGQPTDANGVVRSRSEQIIEQRGGTANLNRQTGGLRNVPAVFAPGLAAAGLETCLGSISGGGAGMGFGFSFGSTVKDPDCSARLDSRTLWSMGLKKAAVARLCLTPEIRQSMQDVCQEYAPLPGSAPVAIAEVAPAPYQGGRVMVIEHRTGRERACDAYDPARRRCLRWGSR